MNDYDILPVRFGGDAGGDIERSMLMRVGGANTIRTDVEVLTDGTVVTLNTRAGNPEFLIEKPVEDVSIERRGFVIRLPDDRYGALFSPYSFQAINPSHPIYDHQFTVTKFDTSEAPIDWYDVLCNKSKSGYINGVAGNEHSLVRGFPYLPAESPLYVSNGLWSVCAKKAKHVGGTEVLLQPTTPASDMKTLFGGPWVKAAEDRVHMTQVWYSGSYWNDPSGDFGYSCSTYVLSDSTAAAEIRYTPSVAVPAPSFSASSSTGSSSFYRGLPDCRGWYSVGYKTDPAWPDGDHFTPDIVEFGMIPAREYVTTSFSRTTWSATGVASLQFSTDETVDVSISNVFVMSNNTHAGSPERLETKPHRAGLVDADVWASGDHMADDGSVIVGGIWDIDTVVDSGPDYNYGWGSAKISPYQSPATASDVTKEQTLSYTASLGTHGAILELTGSYSSLVGTKTNWTKVDPTQAALDESFSWLTGLSMSFWPDSMTEGESLNPVKSAFWGASIDKYKQEAVSLLSPGFQSTRDYIFLQGGFTAADPVHNGSLSMSQDWVTRDYFWFDSDEDMYGWVEGVSSSSGGEQSLNVSVKFSIRGSLFEKPLESYVFPTSDIFALVRADEDVPGSECIPTPRLNVIFMPAIRQHGAFAGIAFTTKVEEAAGIEPVVLMNFRLRLSMYGNMGGQQPDLPSGNTLTFTPYLLIEMLYGYVFSHWGGNHPTERYPAGSPSIYNSISRTLFSTEYKFQYSSGAEIDWVSDVTGINGEYASRSSEVEIYRS